MLIVLWFSKTPVKENQKSHGLYLITPLGPRPAAALSLRNPLRREVTVKWSWYTTLKINNQHQTKGSVHFIFFPVCKYSVLVYPTGFDFFTKKIKTVKTKSQVRNVCIWMSCFGGVGGGYRVTDFAKFQFESPKMKLCEFVRVPTVSNWARFAVQISKDEAPAPLLTVGLLFIFGHLSHVHLTTLKIHSISQTSLNFKQRTLPEIVNSSGSEATGLTRIPFLFA